MAALIQRLQTRSNLVNQLRHRYWVLRYLEGLAGEKVEALVLERGPRRVNLVLSSVLLEGELPANQAMNIEPGDTVRVRLARASALDNELRLEW